ncbi:MAG TPA: hypothetical protein VEG84_04635, partial [Thermoanaerobaculia bacterium]|nr:hypothetical protein [Thermoanaerobaculia bacterium]
GPFRGGRVLAVAGIPGDPVTYYFGAVGGGVWKTTNAGRVWKPIFDETGVASIGAIAVAPSDANVLYVGTGEADMRSDIGFGAGVYKSTDAGRSWAFTGLRDTIHIGRILVDPRDSNVVLVAALGHAYRPNEERGVFRSEDGGKTWRKTLYKGADTGAIDLAYAPGDARTVYAALWQTRRPPWNAYPPTDGPGGGLYRSTDGGATWAPLAGSGLPSGAIGRAGFATAPPGAAHRIYALIDAKDSRQAGLYRSDDAGSSWRLVGTDRRIIDRGWYFSHVIADPKDPDTVWVANVSLYRSRDGGSTFTAIKGAPGGDDYHALWIDPGDTRRMILGCDQGAAVSLDGGETWSSWYNQPTGQFYHVATDGHFPYRVYGAQQDSGTASVSSRSDYGQITFRDWQPVGAEESGCIVPDPKDPDVVYGGGPGGQVFRFSRPTGQSEDVSPWPVPSWGLQPPEMKYRFTWTSPLAFSSDGGVLYLGSQKLLRTSDRGKSWSEASPDLTLSDGVPKSDPGYGRGVIYAIAPSPISKDLIWVGTDNGLIQRTEDGGKTWRNVTPAGLPAWSKIGILEASRYDAATAIAAVDRHRLDDYAPYIYRTHDNGKTWSRITDGIAAPAFVNAVREDPVRRGLLYAATERGVFVSFDDGGRWQPLQQNLPPASVRDLAVEGNDLVAATHGRAFWILDDVTPLRQIEPGGTTFEARLLAPAAALRLRGNVANDTPFPPETATAPNPPEGAVIDYVLPRPAPADVLLEIRDGRGKLVRSFSSRTEPEAPAEPLPFPGFWLKTPKTLAASPGHNRFVWNLRYADPKVLRPDYGIAATVWDGVPLMPRGRLVLPGQYEVRLTAGGQTLTQPLTVKPDPRLAATAEDLRRQFDLLEKIGEALDKTTAFVAEIRGVRTQLARLAPAPPGGASTAITEAALKLDAGAGSIEGVTDAGGRRASGLAGLDGELAHLARAVDNADASPTAQQQAAWEEERRELDGAQARWKELREGDLAALNAKLRQAGKPAIEAGSK